MDLSKPELRKQLKSYRRKLTHDEVKERSQKIIQDCIQLIPWQKVKNLHVYAAIKEENEIDTTALLEFAWQNYLSVQTVVPRLNRAGEYDSVLTTTKTTWLTDGVRIPQPVGGKVLHAHTKFDVIIVPMLGFDANGFRLGHGLGWYDRFLATQLQALTVGLCYEFGHVATGLPHEPHDIPLQVVITEARVHKIAAHHLVQS